MKLLERGVLTVIVASAAAMLAAPASALGETITVNSTGNTVADTGSCTLREAIIAANTDTASGVSVAECLAGSGADDIVFEIGVPLGGVQTIGVLTTVLPEITSQVTIDGTTQNGFAGAPLIQIDGNDISDAAATNDDVLRFGTGSANSIVRGLIIHDGNEYGLRLGANGISVEGSWIGPDFSGGAAFSNDFGGIIVTGNGATVGGSAAAQRNVISGNSIGDGVTVESASGTTIRGNYIGTNSAGTTALGNSRGVALSIASGANFVLGNVISGNFNTGLTLDNLPGGSVTVRGNLLGTSADGTTAVGNGNQGMRVDNVGTVPITIGGALPVQRNVIAASGDSAIRLEGTSATTVQGNLIGTDASGGGDPAAFGNNQAGVNDGSTAGIQLTTNVHNAIIGGIAAGEGNTIANTEASDGITLDDRSGLGLVTGAGNRIRGNRMFGNEGLGIDLASNPPGADGVTPNDAGDVDIGAGGQRMQNFPLITSAVRNASTVNVGASMVNGEANATLSLDFFASTSCDPSGNGEGENYVGTAAAITDAMGNASVVASFPTTSPAGATRITATATRTDIPQGDTSEFSACFTAGALVDAPVVPVVPPVPAGAGIAGLAAGSVKLKKNTVPLGISCQAGGPTCVGSVELETASPVSLAATVAAKKKIVALGSAPFSIPAGQTATVNVRLTKRGRKLSKRVRKIRANATLSTNGTPPRTVTQALKVKT